MAALPTQSAQKPNIMILNRIRLGEFVTKVPALATVIEGEWLILDDTTDAWARADSSFASDAIKACFPVIGKASEHMNAALRTSAGGSQGAVPLYLGTLPLIVDTKVYDEDDTWAVGNIAYIGDIVHGGVTYAGFIDAAGIPAGRVIKTPDQNNGWLRVLVTFC